MDSIKILCIGDSLCLPRKGCLYDDTWYARIKKRFPTVDFISCFKGGMLAIDAWENYKGHFHYSSVDIMISQFGVCDCAPRYINDNRLYGKMLVSLFTKFKLETYFWKFVKIFGRHPDCVYTKPSAFISLYSTLVDTFFGDGGKYAVLIKIGHGAPSVEAASSHFNSNVDKYNEMIGELKNKYNDKIIVIDPLNEVEDSMFVDGYHCNKIGMESVYSDLEKVIHHLINED